jgi:hypothetical protein
MNLRCGGSGWSSEDLSEINRKRWQDPEYRIKQTEAVAKATSARWQDPEYRLKVSAGVKAAIASGKVRGPAKRPRSEESRQKMRDIMQAKWQDPEYRLKQRSIRDLALTAKGFTLRSEEFRRKRELKAKRKASRSLAN